MGHGRVADQFKDFLNYKEAKKVVKQFELKTAKEWKEFAKTNKKPSNIPAAPQNYYENKGWVSWPVFLGTDFIEIKDRNYFNFDEAKVHLKNLNIKSSTEFREKRKDKTISNRMPPKPYEYYKTSWVSWGDFLGTGAIAGKFRKYLNFLKAKDKIKNKNLNSRIEYHSWVSNNNIMDLPYNPDKNYQSDWNGWYDFLGKK